MRELDLSTLTSKPAVHLNGAALQELPASRSGIRPIEKEKKKTPSFSLAAGTVVSMQVESRIPGGREVSFLGFVVLTDELRVVPKSPKKEASSGAEMITVVPDSEARQKEDNAFELAGINHDYAAVEGSWWAIQREDARLAQEFMSGREELLEEHNIDLAHVAGIEITVGVLG